MKSAADEWVAKIEASSSSHDVLTQAQWRLLNLAAEGHAGIRAALDEVGRAGFPAALSKRDGETLSYEMGRSIAGALGKIQPRWRMANGDDYVPDDTCAVDVTKFDCDAWAEKVLGDGEPASGSRSRFQLVTARELAEPVSPMRWLIRGIWPERSAGVLAGDKKSLKTWNLQAIALAVAAGRAVFDKYHVTSAGSVLYLCGEGGRDTFANRHQAIAARYGIDGDSLESLPFGAEFGIGMLSDREFTDAVKRHLDELQPKLVILDPLYAYHPHDVEVQNVYARGPMLANLRELIGDGAALIVGDHFNKTSNGRLDLDNIAQAGMSQWADSWILQRHRTVPDLEKGDFGLEVVTATRRGGGKHLEVDWSLQRDTGDPDLISWKAVDWEARPFVEKASVGTEDKIAQHIRQVVADNPFALTETQVLGEVGGNRQKAHETLQRMKTNGVLVVEKKQRPEGNRTKSRMLVGLAEPDGGIRVKEFSGTGSSERVAATDTGGGTGSERVDR